MPRQGGTTVTNTFVRGLVTEATGLNFPENAVTNCENVIFDESGYITRRPGIDYEKDYVVNTGSVDSYKHAYVWETVGQNGQVRFAVTQVGEIIRFYKEVDSEFSPNLNAFSLDLTTYKSGTGVTAADMKEQRASFSNGNGFLFIAHPLSEPIYVEYDSVGDTFTVNQIDIKVRDFVGLDDGLEIDERPTTLSEEHEYNLQNQSWSGLTVQITGGGFNSPLGYWDAVQPDFPSNSDIAWVYKDGNAQFNSGNFYRFRYGTSFSPKGSKILDAFNQVRKIEYEESLGIPTNSNVTSGLEHTVDTKTSGTARPNSTAFYSGRVWWAGVNYPEFNGNIYFSKVIEQSQDFGVCHQINDPTSEDFNDLLSTDGGLIAIPEISQVVFMTVIQDSLFIFAENGVWTISGSDVSGFRADDFLIRKVSDIGALSADSFINARNTPFWWNRSGIYTLEQEGGLYQVVNLTQQTIQDFFETDPNSYIYVSGAYNEIENRLTWLYRDSTPANFTENFYFNKALTFDLDTAAFSSYSFDLTNVKILGIINLDGEFPLYDVGGGRTVIRNIGRTNKYFVHNGTGFTWAELNVDNHKDWYSHDDTGVNYESNFTAGYVLRGESNRDYQSNYMTITTATDADASFFVSGRWDYANNSVTGRFTTRQQGYKHQANTDYSSRKLKIRGTGKALQYRVESDADKPYRISGWATYDTVVGMV